MSQDNRDKTKKVDLTLGLKNIDFVKKVLDLYFFRIPKKQASNLYYQYVKFRDDDDEE